MKFDVVTLFPKMFESPFDESMIKRAVDKKIIEINLHNLRDWAVDSYGAVDAHPFGGGVGMLIRPEPVFDAIKSVTSQESLVTSKKSRIILLGARGKRYTQAKAEKLAKMDQITLICGHYEGFDQRVADYMVDGEISVGDFVLTGGELAAMVIIDSVTRLLPGVLGKDESNKSESFSLAEVNGKKKRIIEYPQYTRPREFNGWKVPEVLLSGDPKKIEEWKLEQSRSK